MKSGVDGTSCSVGNTGLVTCGNTTYQIPVPLSGINGASCTVSNSGLVQCGTSTYQIPLPANGASCSVNGSGLITCGSTTYQVPTPSNGSDGQSVGVRILSITAGVTCAAGGFSLQSFLDSDKDGAYDAGETLLGTVSNLCKGENGATGSQGSAGFNSLIATSTEAPGANCANGGTKFQSGLDNGDGAGTANNGTLENGEVDSTSYVCTGLNAYVLNSNLVKLGVTFDPYSSSTFKTVLRDGVSVEFLKDSGYLNISELLLRNGVGAGGYICYFTTMNCTGLCYIGIESGYDPTAAYKLNSNHIVSKSSSDFLRPNGSETSQLNLSTNSYFNPPSQGTPNGSCQTASRTLSIAFSLTNSYNLPSGISNPASAPLTVKFE